MTINNTTRPEILDNAEFVVIQFPLTAKERRKRAMAIGVLAGTASTVGLAICIGIARHMATPFPPEN